MSSSTKLKPYEDPVSAEVPIERFQGFLIFTDVNGRYYWVGSGDERDTVEEVRTEIAAYMAAAIGERG